MAKATKQLGGGAKDKYFRDLFAAAPGLDAAMARRLVELTKAEVSQVRVRQPLADRAKLLAGVSGKATASIAPQQARMAPAEQAGTSPLAQHAKPKAADNTAPDKSAATAVAATAPFDPFAFTAVVVLKRQGADALAERLAAITEPDHLRLLADKQHLGVPADAHDAATLRAAILKSAQDRIDDRRAAAS